MSPDASYLYVVTELNLDEASPEKGDYYAAFWLGSNQVTLRDSEVRYCKFAYGSYAGGMNSSAYTVGHDIRDSIFRNCSYGLGVYTATNPTNPAAVRNNLFVNVGWAITLYSANNWGVYNNTFDGPSNIGLCFLSQCSSFNVKYNIFTQTTDPIAGTPGVGCTIQYNAFYSSPQEGLSPIVLTESPYDTSSPGLGLHYLNNATNGGQKCRTGPWTATPSEAGLYDKVYTVNKPNPVSGTKTSAEDWGIIGSARAEKPVALGYHHNRVDYTLTGDVTFSTTTGVLTIEPGVVVCIGDLSTSRSLNADNGGKIVSAGEPGGNGYNVITTCPTSSMYVKAKPFDNQLQGILKIYAGASPNCRVSHTRFVWNADLYLYRRLLSPIESNRFACAYYGVCNNAENSIQNNLFYVCSSGVYDAGTFVGTTTCSNNTFDHCPTGFRCITSGSGRATVVRDSLFTKCSYGLYAMQYTGATFTEDHNAFWLNTINLYKDGAVGTPNPASDIVLDIDHCPYDRPAGNYDDGPKRNAATWYLDQTSDSTIVDDGSSTSIDAGLDILTTSADGRPDTGAPWQDPQDVWRPNKLDIGYHFPIGPAQSILHPGLRQTDITLRWNNMTDGCVRAFSFDGSTSDEMGKENGNPSNVGYTYYRYTGSDPYRAKYDYNRCAAFNGSSSKVDIGNAADLQTGQMASGTIAAWIYAVGVGDGPQPTIFYKGHNSGGASRWLCLTDVSLEEKTARLRGWVGWATPAEATSEPLFFLKTVSERRWHHVAMTWDTTTHELKIYYDGDIAGSSSGSDDLVPDTDQHAFIGRGIENGQESDHFQGYIADVFIFNKVLDLPRIRQLALKEHDGWLVTPNFGAMGEPYKPGTQYETGYPLGQMQGSDCAVQSNDQDPDGVSIWVNEHGAFRVTKLSPEGPVIRKIGGQRGIGDNQLWDPYGIAIDSQNNVYVVNSGTSSGWEPYATRISVFGSDGAYKGRFGSYGTGDEQLIIPFFIAVNAPFVYVTDAGNFRIQKWTVQIEPFEARFQGWWGRRARVNPAQFNGTGLNDMTSGGRYSGDGTAQYRVQIAGVSPDTFNWSDDGTTNWDNQQPIVMTVLAQTLNHHVTVTFGQATGHTAGDCWTFSGQYLASGLHAPGSEGVGVPREGAQSGANFYQPRGIAIDSDGDVWVCDRGDVGMDGFLKEFDPDGPFKSEFSTILQNPYTDYTSGLGILKGPPDYIYSSGGGELSASNHIAKWTTGGQLILLFNGPGTGLDEAHGPWGGVRYPRAGPQNPLHVLVRREGHEVGARRDLDPDVLVHRSKRRLHHEVQEHLFAGQTRLPEGLSCAGRVYRGVPGLHRRVQHLPEPRRGAVRGGQPDRQQWL
jgi:hypothetical protein